MKSEEIDKVMSEIQRVILDLPQPGGVRLHPGSECDALRRNLVECEKHFRRLLPTFDPMPRFGRCPYCARILGESHSPECTWAWAVSQEIIEVEP